jgi:hypothetical protein
MWQLFFQLVNTICFAYFCLVLITCSSKKLSGIKCMSFIIIITYALNDTLHIVKEAFVFSYHKAHTHE